MHFEWDENVLKMWEHSKQVCAEVLRAAGGVLESSGGEPEIPGFSLHETGTCRMGNDPKTSVVDKYHKAHEVPNLYVVDGSSFVTGGRNHPTLTIQALAFRAAEHIVRAAKAGTLTRL